MLRSILAVAIGAAAISFVVPAMAAQPFDGTWSVQAVPETHNARCVNRSVALRVEGGDIKYAGLLSGIASGKVDARGKLVARIAKIRVSGKLVSATGSGAWRSPNCAGTWTAQRN
jgi:hypothetical protein